MRERYLEVFDEITIDCLNGDKYKTGKLTPDGRPDPSVFSTEANREGIQVGTAIAMLVRKPLSDKCSRRSDKGDPPASGTLPIQTPVRFRHFWGRTKRQELVSSLTESNCPGYECFTPVAELGFAFAPEIKRNAYLSWPQLIELIPHLFSGVQTSRDEALVAFEHDALVFRMRRYFDPNVSNEELAGAYPSLMKPAFDYEPVKTRTNLLRRGFKPEQVFRYGYRPFDVRWLYWEGETKLLHRPSPDYIPHVFEGSLALVTQRKPRKSWGPPQIVSAVGCLDIMDRGASFFPLYLRFAKSPAAGLFAQPEAVKTEANITPVAVAYLARLRSTPEELFFHILATLHSPAFYLENAAALRQDWPRVPLPATREALEASAILGRQIAALLDPEIPVPGVTAGGIRPEVKEVATLKGQDLHIKAGWGSAGKGGIVMPGKGRITAREVQITDTPTKDTIAPSRLVDIWLNDTTCWRNIPEGVWEYTLGGYQVLKKWLSYRDASLLGRALSSDEARELTHIARRIAALRLLEPQLDQNYALIKSATAKLPGS